MARYPTASSLERAMNCPASCVLQEVGHPAGEAAAFGQEVHTYLERVPQVGQETALESVPEQYRVYCESLPLDRLPIQPGKFLQEVAFAVNVDTGEAKELGRSIGRNYPRLPGRWCYGTADVVSQLGARKGYVADYKTGAEANVPTPEKNPQLLTLAYAASMVYGWDECNSELFFLRDSSVWPKKATYSDLDLAAHFSELQKLFDRIDKLDSNANAPACCEGHWCRWCSSFKLCPAKTRLASAIVTGDDERLVLRLDKDTIPVIWERLEAAQAVLDAIRGACQSFAQVQPVPLPDGRVFGPKESKIEHLDGDASFELLTQKYGMDVAYSATKRTCSKTTLKEALRPIVKAAKDRGEKVSLAGLEREVVASLRELGKVDEVVSVRIEPHWPKAE
jgi:hypothetical protein